MRPSLTPSAASLMLAGALVLVTLPANAECTRLGFTVNDYGKEGPTNDAKSLLDKHIAKKMAERGVKTYTTGKKDVKCELFLNFIVFDEHTCTAEATVCWNGTALPKGQQIDAKTTTTPAADKQATGSIEKPGEKAAEKPAAKAPGKKPGEAIPAEAKSEEAKPAESKPAETKSTEAKPEEVKPAAKPDEDKPPVPLDKRPAADAPATSAAVKEVAPVAAEKDKSPSADAVKPTKKPADAAGYPTPQPPTPGTP